MRVAVPVVCAMMLTGGPMGPEAHAAPRRGAAERSPAPASPAAGGWSAPQCGREPAPPSVDTSTVQRYNASVDQVTAYDQAARAFDACVSRQATADQTEISNGARTRIEAIQSVSTGVQKRIASNFASLSDALRRGVPKSGSR